VSVSDLPALNAALNLTATVLLVIGWFLIKAKRIDAHRRFMIAAFCTSGAFLVSYLIYHGQVGSRPFTGTGVLRTIYFSILIPHVILAAAILPLAILTLRRGLLRRDAAHRRVARITLPLWLFVSVSGVVVYVMLYQL
jgi:uncharacterized membrane protein YozB (DUF420 family)